LLQVEVVEEHGLVVVVVQAGFYQKLFS